jgi:acyl-homoserine-lactone acylase
MHTSSGVDNIDEYNETVTKKGEGFVYRYGKEERPLTETKITVPYKTAGGMAKKEFTIYRTHHGPVVRQNAGKWITVRMMQEPLKALTQSYSRTKSKNYKDFEFDGVPLTNSSNNTISPMPTATSGTHANFIPKRDPSSTGRSPSTAAIPPRNGAR